MSVLIKGMEMPTSCNDCPMCYDMMQCSIADPIINFFKVKKEFDFCAERHPRCPLVPVPPHGRLVDADELFKEMERKGWFDNADRDIAEDLVLATPTIIESTIGQLNSDPAVNKANANTSNALNALDCVGESENEYGCVYRTTDGKCEFYSDHGKGIVSWCDFDDCEDKKPSNADRIRTMKNEELAEFLEDVAMQGGIELGGRLTTWLDWLKQEAKDEHTD